MGVHITWKTYDSEAPAEFSENDRQVYQLEHLLVAFCDTGHKLEYNITAYIGIAIFQCLFQLNV